MIAREGFARHTKLDSLVFSATFSLPLSDIFSRQMDL